MKKGLFCLIFGVILSSMAQASTVAYWRFEEGVVGEHVEHLVSSGTYYAAVTDYSGNGNELSVWDEGGAGYIYSTGVSGYLVPQTGVSNNLSVRNAGGGPAMWTSSFDSINNITPSAFTVEVSFKLENGGYRTIVGRDSIGTVSSNSNFAALYLQAMPDNRLAIKFSDVSGRWHEAISDVNVFKSFNNSSNPNGAGVPWYSLAAVSDGMNLSLYLLNHAQKNGYQLIAMTDLTQSGSPNTALSAGGGDGPDWDRGNWSVGRGLYEGVHKDRAFGFIDEIRISDSALSVSEFLGEKANDGTVAYWRFEEGLNDDVVEHSVGAGVYYAAIADSSGNGNELSVWDEGWAGYTYRDDMGYAKVDEQANRFCVQNIGVDPAMWTIATDSVSLISPSEFTIEATFKLENGSYRTIIGRDSYGVVGDAALAAVYFQALPENRVAIKFADVSGYWHEAVSNINVIETFDPLSNPGGAGVPWYSMAGVSDGFVLSLYLRNISEDGDWQLVAQQDITQSGSGDRALTAGAGDGLDWDAGCWSVGRGLHNGEHKDRAKGFIDEVRISNIARDVSSLLDVKIASSKNWLGFMDSNKSLSDLSIPGTHDSGARYEPFGGTAKCQNLTISEQLNAGVRYLDIRCRHIDNMFTIHHGQVYQNINFDDVLNAVNSFLDENPSESVMMSVKEEYDSENTTRSFEATFDSYVASNPSRWYLGNAIPSVSQARGRIVLVRRFGAGSPKGINATNWADNTTFTINNGVLSLRVQDYYNNSSDTAKWNSITPLLSEAYNGGPEVLYLNYTSGYKTTFILPSITTISNSINPKLETYFTSHSDGRYGVIVMDFVNETRSALIIETNFGEYNQDAKGRINIADIGGLNGVNGVDFAVFANSWLSENGDSDYNPVCDMDRMLDSENIIDVADLTVLVENWLEGF